MQTSQTFILGSIQSKHFAVCLRLCKDNYRLQSLAEATNDIKPICAISRSDTNPKYLDSRLSSSLVSCVRHLKNKPVYQ